jgi:catalase
VTTKTFPLDGRVVHILANDDCDLDGVRSLQASLLAAGVTPHVVAPHKGEITGGDGDSLLVDRSLLTSSPAEADGVVVAGGAALASNPKAIAYLQGAHRYLKTVAVWGTGIELLEMAGIVAREGGVVVSETADQRFGETVIAALSSHRHWGRAPLSPTLEEA